MQTLRQLFQQIGPAESFDPERLEEIEQALVENQRSDMPWYLRFIIGLGAWISSIFFLVFFLILWGTQTKFDENRAGFGVMGLILVCLCTGLFRLNFGLFVSQCCLAFCMAGQLMIYVGFLPDGAPLGSAIILSVLLAAVLYLPYSDPVLRWINCTVVLQLLMARIYMGPNGDTPQHDVAFWSSFYWVVLLLAMVGICVWVGRARSVNLAPLGYAVALSMPAWQLWNYDNFWYMYGQTAPLADLFMCSVYTALVLFAVTVWAAGGPIALLRYKIPFASLACTFIAILWLGAGGLFLPLLFMTLGFFVENRVLQLLGLVLFPIFLSDYYYNLKLDLLAKSAVLLASGLTLLLLRFSLNGWFQRTGQTI